MHNIQEIVSEENGVPENQDIQILVEGDEPKRQRDHTEDQCTSDTLCLQTSGTRQYGRLILSWITELLQRVIGVVLDTKSLMVVLFIIAIIITMHSLS